MQRIIACLLASLAATNAFAIPSPMTFQEMESAPLPLTPCEIVQRNVEDLPALAESLIYSRLGYTSEAFMFATRARQVPKPIELPDLLREARLMDQSSALFWRIRWLENESRRLECHSPAEPATTENQN